MKVLLVMDSVSRAAGGLLDAERCLHQGLSERGVETSVFALEDEHTAADLPAWNPLVPQAFPHQGPAALGCALDMRRAILTVPSDLIYRAGLWRLPSRYAHEWTRKFRRSEIIAPHGMLDPWAVRNSRWKKRLAHLWFEGAHLRDAACIRALSESEAQAVRAYGLTNPVCVIPNGMELPEGVEEVSGWRLAVGGDCEEEEKTESRKQKAEMGRKILFFLGRLHPKKGLVNALKAWAEVGGRRSEGGDREEWQFVIAGWDQGGHETELKRLCVELGLAYAETPASDFLTNNQELLTDNASVIFTGPAFGTTKDQLLRRASAFILPSFSEGLPMSVLEAWSYRLPVLMTEHCNIPEGFLSDAALRIGTDVASIADGMSDLFRSPACDLQSLGANGRALVERQFTWPQVAVQMKEVYDWVLGGGSAPDCVRL